MVAGTFPVSLTPFADTLSLLPERSLTFPGACTLMGKGWRNEVLPGFTKSVQTGSRRLALSSAPPNPDLHWAWLRLRRPQNLGWRTHFRLSFAPDGDTVNISSCRFC